MDRAKLLSESLDFGAEEEGAVLSTSRLGFLLWPLRDSMAGRRPSEGEAEPGEEEDMMISLVGLR